MMLGPLKAISDKLLGRGSAALTVPPLDGALRPNNRLEDAPPGIAAKAPDCLSLKGGAPIWAEGNSLMNPDGVIQAASSQISAIASSPGGAFALAIDGVGVTINDTPQPALAALSCITALAFEDDNILWIAVGSTENPSINWARDLLERRRNGRIIRYDVKAGKARTVVDRLAYPNGIAWTGNGMIVSEAWAKQLIRVDRVGGVEPVISDLPGYPAGVSPSGAGGFWLALFAPRSPLIELVLREPAYRKAMMQEVDPAYWIAPALRSGQSFLEPMQGGALKQMGVLKPWAPTRSFGMAVELSDGFTPIRSLHSRAGGKRHGITSVLECDGELWLTSKGGDEVIRIDLLEGGLQ